MEVRRRDLARWIASHSPELPDAINDHGVRYRWIGINGVGWVNDGPPRGSEPIVVDDPWPKKKGA